MLQTERGAIPLFRLFGIQVYVHWSWLIILMWWLEGEKNRPTFDNMVFAIYEVLAVFAIVTCHEFGHALACRQTGGDAHRIVLGPLGGIAFVSPPRRAGAQLWSIVAGPLVNVAFIPLLAALTVVAGNLGWASSAPDTFHLIDSLRVINLWLLGFNMLPVFPLDGGQTLRSLLWFGLGERRSLQVAAGFGIVLAGGIGLWMLHRGDTYYAIMAGYIFANALQGWRAAQAMKAAGYP